MGVTVTDSSQLTASAQYILVIQAAIPTLLITTTSPLPAGVLGANYSAQVAATGGVPGYFFAVTAGSLPAGVSLSPNGILTGIPTKTGDYSFTVQVTDFRGSAASAGFLLSIKATPLIITTAPLADTLVGTSFNTQFTATGGVPPYAWGSSGTIPAGTTFSGSGTLSGTANSAGTFQFTIQVTDSVGTVAAKAYSINITKQPLTISGSAGNRQVGVPYSATFGAAGGRTPIYSFSAKGGMPAGLTFPEPLISGTPVVGAEGTYTVIVTVTDAAGAKASADSSVTIAPALLQITTTSLPDGIAGSAYSGEHNASGGVLPNSFSARGLPNDVSMSAGGAIADGRSRPRRIRAISR